MRYLVISDIHSNLLALNAVIADAGSFDRIWCLGDITGYGPNPNECIARLREFPLTTLAGNHDWAVLGLLSLTDFNQDARAACVWTRQHLSAENKEYLSTLPVMLEEDGYFDKTGFRYIQQRQKHPYLIPRQMPGTAD